MQIHDLFTTVGRPSSDMQDVVTAVCVVSNTYNCQWNYALIGLWKQWRIKFRAVTHVGIYTVFYGWSTCASFGWKSLDSFIQKWSHVRDVCWSEACSRENSPFSSNIHTVRPPVILFQVHHKAARQLRSKQNITWHRCPAVAQRRSVFSFTDLRAAAMLFLTVCGNLCLISYWWQEDHHNQVFISACCSLRSWIGLEHWWFQVMWSTCGRDGKMFTSLTPDCGCSQSYEVKLCLLWICSSVCSVLLSHAVLQMSDGG